MWRATNRKKSDYQTHVASDLLAEARRLIESGWCQRTAARNDSGRSVLPADPAATSWSATGALICAYRRHPAQGDSRAPEAFALAMTALVAAVGDSPQRWNDQRGRKRDEIVAALTAAAKLVVTRTDSRQ